MFSTVKEMTYFSEIRVKNLKTKKEMKKSSVAAKKTNKKILKKRKREGFDSSVVEFDEESSVECRPHEKYCILHGKCSHSTDNCQD